MEWDWEDEGLETGGNRVSSDRARLGFREWMGQGFVGKHYKCEGVLNDPYIR